MEGLISAFPFIAQDGPTQSGRPSRSTFVRAHVMERYHRERRAKKDSKEAGIGWKAEQHFVVTPKLQWQEVNGIEKTLEQGRKTMTPNSKTRKLKKEVGKHDKGERKGPIGGTESQIILLERPELYSMTLRNPIKEDSARFLRNISTCKQSHFFGYMHFRKKASHCPEQPMLIHTSSRRLKNAGFSLDSFRRDAQGLAPSGLLRPRALPCQFLELFNACERTHPRA
jgi:hypothetical protein